MMLCPCGEPITPEYQNKCRALDFPCKPMCGECFDDNFRTFKFTEKPLIPSPRNTRTEKPGPRENPIFLDHGNWRTKPKEYPKG